MTYSVQHLIDQLRDARLRQGLTRGSVGRRAGIRPSTIEKWERGALVPLLPSLIEYAAALGMQVTLTEVPR